MNLTEYKIKFNLERTTSMIAHDYLQHEIKGIEDDMIFVNIYMYIVHTVYNRQINCITNCHHEASIKGSKTLTTRIMICVIYIYIYILNSWRGE